MKSPKEDYNIRKSVVSDPGTREDPTHLPLLLYTCYLSCYLHLEAINVLLKYLIYVNVFMSLGYFFIY